MNMSTAVYEKSKESISIAFDRSDAELIEKEIVSIINLFATTIPNIFPDSVRFVGVREPVYKAMSSIQIKKELITALDILNSCRNFSEVKLAFQKLFLQTTVEGYIDFDYQDSELLSVEDAASELNCSRQSIYNYIKKGMEYKKSNNVRKVAKSTIDLWKDPGTAFELQWMVQEDKKRRQGTREKYKAVQDEINIFELDYGDTFENLYGDLSNDEIDSLNEAVDVYDWHELIEEKKELLKHIKRSK
ncbi:helix-turn-helix domain-containing protein [Sporolactobacillus sp. STCC-11]|uniref:helix-turn-helix domain-containing protein n=1 Tax=Sporolactobacillus caesalpiniae TaxID=3230362 RepID=UPI003395441C